MWSRYRDWNQWSKQKFLHSVRAKFSALANTGVLWC